MFGFALGTVIRLETLLVFSFYLGPEEQTSTILMIFDATLVICYLPRPRSSALFLVVSLKRPCFSTAMDLRYKYSIDNLILERDLCFV